SASPDRYTFPYTTLFRSHDLQHHAADLLLDDRPHHAGRRPEVSAADEPAILEHHGALGAGAGQVQHLPFPAPLEHAAREGLLERSEEHTSELQSPCNLVC